MRVHYGCAWWYAYFIVASGPGGKNEMQVTMLWRLMGLSPVAYIVYGCWTSQWHGRFI